MKSSEILRNAAKLVEDGVEEFGCQAIGKSMGFQYPTSFDVWDSYPMEYLRLIGKPKLKMHNVIWNQRGGGPRIIGLCLAAAIAESEGD